MAAAPSGAGNDGSPPPPHKWSLPFLKLWKEKNRRANPPMPKKYGSFHNFFACFRKEKQKDSEECLVQCPYNIRPYISSSTDFETLARKDGWSTLTRSHHIRHLERRSNSLDNKNLFEDRGGAGPSQWSPGQSSTQNLFESRGGAGPSQCPPKSTGHSSTQQEAPFQGCSRMLPHSEITKDVLQPVEITDEEEVPLRRRPRNLLQSEITEEVLQSNEMTEEEEAPPHSEITEDVLQSNEITEEEEAPLQHLSRMLPHSEITEEAPEEAPFVPRISFTQ